MIQPTNPASAAEAADFEQSGGWAPEAEGPGRWFGEHAARVALVDRAGVMTYRELDITSRRLASSLRDIGVQPGDAVMIIAANDRWSVAAYHATGWLGATAVLVQKSSGAAPAQFAAAASRPAAVLLASGTEQLGATIGGVPLGIHGIDDLLHGAAEPDRGEDDPLFAGPPTVDPNAPRVVIFTSGTTANAKGVIHTWNTLRASVANYRAMTQITADDRFFVVLPLASVAGVLQALELAPRLGACAVLEDAWSPEGTLDFLVDTGGTFYGGSDVVLRQVLEAARARGVRVPLRAASLGGAAMRTDVLSLVEDEFGIRVLRVYGSSEAPNTTGSRPDEPDAVRTADEGRAGPDVEIRLADDGTNEIRIRGPHVFRGYVDPSDNDGAFDGEWFRTGDIGLVVDGRLRVVGRLKEIASRNGRKVSLAEVEQAFGRAAELAQCAAFVVPDDTTGERIALAVVIAPDAPVDVPSVLEAMVRSGVPKWKLPESVVRYEHPLPMTASGKVRRRELSEDDGIVLWAAPRLSARSAPGRASTEGAT